MPYDPTFAPVLTGEQIAALEAPKDYFLLGPHLLNRGGRGLIGGLSGIGKSFILMNLTRAFMNGSQPFNIPEWTAEKARVLYVDLELGKYMFGERLKEMFSKDELHEFGDGFRIISMPVGLSLSNPEAVQWLKSYCEINGIDVLMLDPISKMHYWGESADGGAQVSENLMRIGGEKTAIIVTHHFRKPATGRDAENYDPHSMYNFRGSVGTRLVEDASFVMTVDRHSIKKHPHEHWKLKARLDKLRHTGGIETDFDFNVNFDNDRRIVYDARRVPKPLTTEELAEISGITPKKGPLDITFA